jgi:hypothetical protein
MCEKTKTVVSYSVSDPVHFNEGSAPDPSSESHFLSNIFVLIFLSLKVEDTYKKVNNGEWGWRALRLMSRKSPHFFISGNNPIAKVFFH